MVLLGSMEKLVIASTSVFLPGMDVPMSVGMILSVIFDVIEPLLIV